MRRFIFFLILLGTGFGLLYFLTQAPYVQQPPAPQTDLPRPKILETENTASQITAAGALIKQLNKKPLPDGTFQNVLVYQFFVEKFFLEKRDEYSLEGVTLHLFREDGAAQEPAMILKAEKGRAFLIGSMRDEFKLNEEKPVFLQNVVADLFDPQAEFPPLRIRTTNLHGQIKEKKFWTEEHATLEGVDNPDFWAEGVGLEGDALIGGILLKRDPRVRYLQRDATTLEPQRELTLRCNGPLEIQRLDASTSAASASREIAGRRKAKAFDQVNLMIKNLKDESIQTLSANYLEASLRMEQERSKKSPFLFEALLAKQNVALDAGQAVLFADECAASMTKSGRLELATFTGHAHALISGESSHLLDPAQNNLIYLTCNNTMSIMEEPEPLSGYRLIFLDHVLLFGLSKHMHQASSFEKYLELILEKSISEQSQDGAANTPKLSSGNGSGGIIWQDQTARVVSATMEFQPDEQKNIGVAFYPHAFIEGDFQLDLAGRAAAQSAEEKKLVLFAEQGIVQEAGTKNIYLKGEVLGNLLQNAKTAGQIAAKDLWVNTGKQGAVQFATQQGFFFEDASGNYVHADSMTPWQETGTQMQGKPAILHAPFGEDSNLIVQGEVIQYDQYSGALQGNTSVSIEAPFGSLLKAPQENTAAHNKPQTLQLHCERFAAQAKNNSLQWLQAFQNVRIISANQQAGCETLHLNMEEDLHRLFGPPENPAWIKSPLQDGNFLASSVRIEIREQGERIQLAPRATIEISGGAVDLGDLTPEDTKSGIRIKPTGETLFLRDRILFQGGVLCTPIHSKEQHPSQLFAEQIVLFRNSQTGELEKLEATGKAEFSSADIIAHGDKLIYVPQTHILKIYGTQEELAAIQLFRNNEESKMVGLYFFYNSQSRLVEETGPASIIRNK